MLRFNFLEREETFIEKLLKPDIILAVLLLFITFGGLFWYTGQLKSKERFLKQEIIRLDRELARLKKIQAEEKKLIKVRETLKEKLNVISKLDKERQVPSFIYFFADRKNIPYGVWLENLKQDGKKIYIAGNAYNLKLVSQFLKNVEEKIGEVKFKKTSYEEYKSKETGATYKYYHFSFTVEMK
ncbi:PilN domain-containing protein [Desulfurobacterium atlanticum]|uniref:Type IV pilus assembly protein PilN n=1 Tax=Desulfurobacterium atlanticum TaxID=240169 RepID=A0A238Z724_9BACT|nr:PilN domain-containing protein [Desulfurobacterium atlanticum]SNR78624.1 type IV pilus assembly protein PilN [Desulfurobacterium atlanticum]